MKILVSKELNKIKGNMRAIIGTICACCLISPHSYGDFELKDNLYSSISNIVEMVTTSQFRTYEVEKKAVEAKVSGLENQLAFAKLRYGWDIQGVKDATSLGIEEDVHGENAFRLELIRSLLNEKIEEMILLERLMQVREMQAKANEVNIKSVSKVCVDIEDFLAKLQRASVVEYKYTTHTDSLQKGSVLISNKDAILSLREYFLSLDMEFDPVLRSNLVNIIDFKSACSSPLVTLKSFDLNNVAELIIGDSSVKICGKNTLLCFGAAYHCKNEDIDFGEQIKFIAGKGSKPEPGSVP